MSAIGDALAAIKRVILLEERIASQGSKLERLAIATVEVEKRLAALEGRMEGFLAAAAAFGGTGNRQAPPERGPVLLPETRRAE